MHRTSNYDYMPLIYINLQLYYLDMQHLSRMPTKLIRMLTKKKSHVNIIRLHVVIIYFACRGQKYATIEFNSKTFPSHFILTDYQQFA